MKLARPTVVQTCFLILGYEATLASFNQFKVTDGYKFCLEGGTWLLIRFSGTEPIIRVYCETNDKSLVKSLLQEGLVIAGLL